MNNKQKADFLKIIKKLETMRDSHLRRTYGAMFRIVLNVPDGCNIFSTILLSFKKKRSLNIKKVAQTEECKESVRAMSE